MQLIRITGKPLAGVSNLWATLEEVLSGYVSNTRVLMKTDEKKSF